MSDYRLVMSIVRREQCEDYLRFFQREGVDVRLVSLCRGTASRSLLDYLGLERTEKVLLQAVTAADKAALLLRRMVGSMGIALPGNGVAVTIPVGSVGGMSSLSYLTQEKTMTNSEVSGMSESLFSLIVAIVDKGHTDSVMTAAREAGARGGTVLNARGTAPGGEATFFGLSIGEEKELIYIVARKADKGAIMHAVMEKAGIRSEAHTVLFSLPVDDMAGLDSLTGET